MALKQLKINFLKNNLKLTLEFLKKKIKTFVDCLKIKPQISINNRNIYVTIGMPDPEIRPPVDVCLTIDVSGSMGFEATLKGDKGETLSYGYSVLSVTVCAAKNNYELFE